MSRGASTRLLKALALCCVTAQSAMAHNGAVALATKT